MRNGTMATVCRVCLSSNLRMNRLESIELQDIFEKLINIKLSWSSPEASLCFVCDAQLQRCGRFASQARRAHAVLMHLLDNQLQPSPETLATLKIEPTTVLSVHHVSTLTQQYMVEPTIKQEEISIKTELTDDYITEDVSEDTKPGIEYKEEESPKRSKVPKTKEPVQRKRRITIEARTCQYCKKVFDRRTELKVHLRIHTGEKPFTCELCSKSFNSSSTLKCHKATHIPLDERPKPFVCSQCGKSFAQKKTLRQHMSTHGEKEFACEQCGKAFVTNMKLKVHMKRHVTERVHTCDRCARTYKTIVDLRNHMIIHSGAKPFSCRSCDKAFARRHELKLHTRVHTGEKPYACHVCGKTFSQSSTLAVHMRTHSEERPFPCAVCGFVFKEKYALARHVAARHARGPPCACAVCGRECGSRRYAQAHARAHARAAAGAPRPACNLCGKTFAFSGDLRRHERKVRCQPHS